MTPSAGLKSFLMHPERTRKMLAALDATEKHVLRYLLSQGAMASEADVMARFPDAAAALAQLRQKGVVIDEPVPGVGPMLVTLREFSRFVSLTPAEKSTLANLLAKQPPAYLADLSAAHGWEKAPLGTLTQKLKQQWPTEDALKGFISQRTEEEQQLWNRAIKAEGVLDLKAHPRSGEPFEPAVPGRLDRTRPLDSLYAYGLLFPNQWPHPTCFVIPSDLQTTLKGKAPSRTLSASAHVPASLRSWGLRLLSDVQLMAAYQSSGRLDYTRNDIPLRHQLRAFLKALATPEEHYGLFLNVSIDAFFSGVMKKESITLDANPAESMNRLIAFWQGGDHWQESSPWRDSHRSPDGHLDKTLKAKRLIVLKVLDEMPTQQWVSYEDFAAKIFESGWKRVDSGIKAPNAYYHNERWQRRDYMPDLPAEETLANMTAESLVWLGLIDVGLGKPRKSEWKVTHVRLTDWGRQYLDKKGGRFDSLPPVKAETQFLVMPNLDISVSPRLQPTLLSQLFKMAVLKGVNSFSLTKDSLRQALDEGLTKEAILEFLAKHSAHAVPPIVQQFVEEVAEKHGHIKLGIAGAYLQVDDPMILLELRSRHALKDIFEKQVGDKLAILNDRDLQKIAKTLRKMGYSPVIEKSADIERMKLRFHW